MRSALIAIGLAFVFATTAVARPAPGPSAQTLIWWRAAARPFSDQPLPGWFEQNAADAATPLISWFGDDAGLALLGRATVWAFTRGHPATGEILASADPQKPEPRSAWLVVSFPKDARGPERMLGELFPAGGLTPEGVEIDGVHASQATPKGWPTPLLWSNSGDRLVLATTSRALLHALGPEEKPSEPVPKDAQSLAGARAKKRPHALDVFTLYANLNGLRRDMDEAFSFRRDADGGFRRDDGLLSAGRGARVLSAWKLTNARSAEVFVGWAEPPRAAKPEPGLVTVDLAYSARSDPPGEGVRCDLLTLDEFPKFQEALRIPGVSALLVVPRDLRPVLDFVQKTYRAALDDDASRAFATTWADWLNMNRKHMDAAAADMAKLFVVGLDRGSGNGAAKAVVPFRLCLGLGADPERVAEHIGTLTRWAGSTEKKLIAGAESVWTVPADLPWLHASAAWSGRRLGETKFIVGALSFDQNADPVAALPEPVRPWDNR